MTSRFKHLLRLPEEEIVLKSLLAADGTTLAHVERIVGRPLPPDALPLVALSASEGGLGFALLKDLSHHELCREARASLERTISLASQADIREELPDLLPAIWAFALRHELPPPRDRTECVGDSDDPKIRLIRSSGKAPHASAFVSSAPGPGTIMSNTEFRDALWLRLQLSAPVGHTSCQPDPIADYLGLHRLGCRYAAGLRTQRHDDLSAVIANTALAADPRAFQVAREERLRDVEDSQARPGDVALNLGAGRTLVDITVASPFSVACQASARLAGTPAAAAESAYDRKMSKWHHLLDEHLLDHRDLTSGFQPLAVTALGAWDERSLLWLRRFSDTCAAATGLECGSAFSNLMTKLSVCLWRGNSRLMRALRERDSPQDSTSEFDEIN